MSESEKFEQPLRDLQIVEKLDPLDMYNAHRSMECGKNEVRQTPA